MQSEQYLGFSGGLTDLRAAGFHPVHPVGKVVCECDCLRTDHIMEWRPTWVTAGKRTKTEEIHSLGLECNFKRNTKHRMEIFRVWIMLNFFNLKKKKSQRPKGNIFCESATIFKNKLLLILRLQLHWDFKFHETRSFLERPWTYKALSHHFLIFLLSSESLGTVLSTMNLTMWCFPKHSPTDLAINFSTIPCLFRKQAFSVVWMVKIYFFLNAVVSIFIYFLESRYLESIASIDGHLAHFIGESYSISR